MVSDSEHTDNQVVSAFFSVVESHAFILVCHLHNEQVAETSVSAKE